MGCVEAFGGWGEMKPRFFGQYLVENGYITEDELADALEYQQKRIMRLGEIAVKQGYMTPEQVEKVNLAQRKTDKFFGELAVEMGFLTEEQLQKIITIQKNNHIYLGEALVEKGYLTREQLERYLEDFHAEQEPISTLKDIIPERLVEWEEVRVVLDVSIKIFRRMANTYLKLGKGFFKARQIENLYLISAVHFAGTVNFRYFLNVPADVASTLTRSLYGDREMVCDDLTVSDCMGELLNVICGNSSSQILELGDRVRIFPPEALLASDFPVLELGEGRQALVFPASVPVGYLEVGFIWEEREGAKAGERSEVKRVLIVDDSAFCRQQLSDIIGSIRGVEVVGTARDGVEALEMFRELSPDIVIVDLIMPGMPGEEVIERIFDYNSLAKVIVLSGVGGSPEKIRQQLRAGVVTVIQKPFDAQSVVAAVKKAAEG